jgi:uncharacterized membrane protein
MHGILDVLAEHWFSFLLLAIAVVLGVSLLNVWRRRGEWSLLLLLTGSAVALLSVGGLALPATWGVWLAGAALALLFVMLLLVIITGSWSAPLGYAVGAVLLLGLGGAASGTVAQGLAEAGKLLQSLEPTQPWWLLLLGLIPVIILLSYRSLAGLGPVRRWVAIALRCSLILFLTLALAEVRIRHQNENITALFLVDRSLSIPEEYDPEAPVDSPRIDLRWDRVEKFINETVALRGPQHKYDRAGLILFGRRPRLELPPSNAPLFNFHFKDAASNIDGNYTDIAAAIKLALASFPEGTGKRIVLISDGNENLGNAEEQARIAKLNGAQIDVVPLAARYRNENEVLVQSVEAPPKTEQGSRVPIRVLIRSYHPRTVYGTLTLEQIADGTRLPVDDSPRNVQLRPGLNSFSFQQPLAGRQQSYTYQAVFQPKAVQNERGGLVAGLAGDRVQNNSATTHVVALGQRRILIVEPSAGQHQLLVDRLSAVGNNKYKVHALTVDALPPNKADLAVFLSNYDCLILANVAASDVEADTQGNIQQTGVLSDEQQEIIRSNTHDQGCGLIMIGGPNGFGAGGWQGTPVEKALPVDCDIKSFKVQGKGGLALIMHACEMADGNRWEKEIAKLAVKKLSPMDEVGIIHWEWGGHKWHIPLQVIGAKRNALLAQVDRMTPGDMPDMDAALKMAHDKLIEPERQLATKHVILITDGDPNHSDKSLLTRMRQNKVSVTTVGVATHGVNEDRKLIDIATKTGGRFYKVQSPRQLPAIYIKETRIVSRSFLYEGRFQPRLLLKSGPTERLPDALPPLYGYVRTTPKQSPLVEMPIVGPPQPDGMDFPILAYWQYGLGRSAAVTSDARTSKDQRRFLGWDREWAGSEMYSKFWEQVVDYALRPTETGQLLMTTEYHDGKVKVTVEARGERDGKKDQALTDLIIEGGITAPSAKTGEPGNAQPRFEQKRSGVYEAEFKADEAGSYFVNAVARRVQDGKVVDMDSVRAGVTIPYSPEFADNESNTSLLEKLRDMTGGKTISEESLARAASPTDPAVETTRAELAGEVFRAGLPQFKNLQPAWFWLVFLAGLLLFFDVAVRRIAVQPADAIAAAERVWERLRGRTAREEQTPQFIERLQSRKLQVSETLDQLRAARRFEPGERTAVAPSGADEAAASRPRSPVSGPAPRPQIAPESQQEPADYASRLLKAKKRVWQERESPEEKPNN